MNTTNLAPPRDFVAPADQLARAQRIAGAVRFSQLAPENIRWLWPNRIPLGRITLLVSDPGLGKSLLTLDIAARVSTGRLWPDAGASGEERGSGEELRLDPRSSLLAPSSVLLLTAEDDLADTVRPRLEALGADCDRILGIAAVPGDKPQDVPRAFALSRDLARLRNLLDAVPDCRLIVIDPISAYLGSTNEHSNADIQSLLLGLTTLARERNLAVLVVSHLRKKEGAAIYRTMGSLAFVAASRAVWAICKDPSDERKRLFVPIKNNLAPTATGLAFTIESQNGTPQLHWSPDPVTHSVDIAIAAARHAGRPNDERQHAMSWLRERLSNGSLAMRQLHEEANAHGIGYGTLRRAFREIDGQSVRRGPFPFGEWHWKLPGVDAQNPEGQFCAPTDFLDEIMNSFSPQPPHPPFSNSPFHTPHSPFRTPDS
jgi:putative DNA primase/helicase